MRKPPLLTRPTGRRGISKNPRVRKAGHIAVITAQNATCLRCGSRENRVLPRQHARPIADLRLCAPPPEHRHVSTAPVNRSRPPSPPCSSPALRLLAPAPVQIFHPRTRVRTHAACEQPLRTHVGRTQKHTRMPGGRPQSSFCFKSCPRTAAQRAFFLCKSCEARALGRTYRYYR